MREERYSPQTCACLDGGVLPMLATKGDHVPTVRAGPTR